MKELLEIYYKGYAEKANYDRLIADDFEYVRGDMAKNTTSNRKIAIAGNLFRHINLR
jgi:hypothetical protein